MNAKNLSTLRGCAHRSFKSRVGCGCRIYAGPWGVVQSSDAAELSRQVVEGNPVGMLSDAASITADIEQSILENVAPALAGLSVGIAIVAAAIYLALNDRQ